MGHGGEDRHTQEHRPQDGAHNHQGGAGIGGLRLAENAHAVGDRLRAGHGGAAVGESARHIKEGNAEQEPPALVAQADLARRGGDMAQVPRCGPDQPGDDKDSHVGDEEVSGYGEQAARFAKAPQVTPCDEDDERDRHRDSGTIEAWHGRDNGVGSCRYGHGHRDRVADQQGCTGDLGHIGAEVVPAHHV